MPLATSLAKQVGSGVRDRGNQYFRNRRVRLETFTDSVVTATVRGSQIYDVELKLDGHELAVQCTCPYATGNLDPCKHVWATILAADERHFGNHIEGPISLYMDYPDEDPDDDDYRAKPQPAPRQGPTTKPQLKAKPRETWQDHFAAVEREAQPTPTSNQWNARPVRESEQRLIYLVDIPSSLTTRKLMLHLGTQPLKKDGTWGVTKAFSGTLDIDHQPDPLDRRILNLLEGADRIANVYIPSYYQNQSSRYRLGEELLDEVLPHLGRTGRVRLYIDPKARLEPPLMAVDEGPPWELALDVSQDETGKNWRLTGSLQRGEESLPLARVDLLIPGVVSWDMRIARFNDGGGYAWVPILRKVGSIEVPIDSGDQLVARLLAIPRPRRTNLPEQLQFAEERIAPRPRLVVKKATTYRGSALQAELTFVYDDLMVPALPFVGNIVQAERKRLIVRDVAAERDALSLFNRLGMQAGWFEGKAGFEISPAKLPKAVREATAAGWLVEAEGKLYRRAGHFELAVKSERDWFDLAGSADFEGKSVPLPRLLDALRQGIKTIVLDDGSVGMLPDEWLAQYGMLARMGTTTGEAVRYSRAQVGVLDALLASRPEIGFDKQFEKARTELKKFEGVEAADPPTSFKGELRGYQRDGLGWLRFLRKFGFGGCLADDMGLGKTVQILALLAGKRKGPALIVVPKSLIFNWKQEAARFAPKLKVLDHTGLARERTSDTFKNFDLILTTYGTLRRDAAMLSGFHFDTCVLDESQFAKNASTDTAKCVKLIQADHRLAMSGTPIENHLGELWTLFDFLNPGMLGRAATFGGEAGSLRNPGPEAREFLAKALRPFILRRTKKQVATDLPDKTEQTVYCELESEQRRLYDELRDHYRQSLLSKVDELGIKRTKIQVLAALLRLRQAACHPGLIDQKLAAGSCAKLDVLLPQLEELAEEGHKALVFSQFTSFLSIVRSRLDAAGTAYEYLDGKTRDREARVERFQTDPNCKIFLVSLKAGGVGLNLTAADYVFLLDPWWNPAAEAQAIDRTHRIGQVKPVFAYRIIAKNTVEEKVLELQKTKRDLADSILGGDERLITELKREDLEMLLS